MENLRTPSLEEYNEPEVKAELLEGAHEMFKIMAEKRALQHLSNKDMETESEPLDKKYEEAKALYAKIMFKYIPDAVNILHLDGEYIIREGREDDKEARIWTSEGVEEYIEGLRDI